MALDTRGSMSMLQRVRAELDRLTPEQALAEQERGALLIDLRTSTHRATSAIIPGSLVIDLTVLPWRLDPTFEYRIPRPPAGITATYCSAAMATRRPWPHGTSASWGSPAPPTWLVATTHGWKPGCPPPPIRLTNGPERHFVETHSQTHISPPAEQTHRNSPKNYYTHVLVCSNVDHDSDAT